MQIVSSPFAANNCLNKKNCKNFPTHKSEKVLVKYLPSKEIERKHRHRGCARILNNIRRNILMEMFQPFFYSIWNSTAFPSWTAPQISRQLSVWPDIFAFLWSNHTLDNTKKLKCQTKIMLNIFPKWLEFWLVFSVNASKFSTSSVVCWKIN